MITPINEHVLIRPIEEKTVFQSSQQTFEERGEIIRLPERICIGFTGIFFLKPIWDELPLKIGQFVFFDSWTAAKYKDSEGNEFWIVPFKHIRAIES